MKVIRKVLREKIDKVLHQWMFEHRDLKVFIPGDEWGAHRGENGEWIETFHKAKIDDRIHPEYKGKIIEIINKYEIDKWIDKSKEAVREQARRALAAAREIAQVIDEWLEEQKSFDDWYEKEKSWTID